MPKIPEALASDTDDVAWALQTANTLWERGEHEDALTWLRRGAQAAAETEDDERAIALARAAADLAEAMTPGSFMSAPAEQQTGATVESPPSIDLDLSSLRGTQVPAEEEDEVVTSAPPIELLKRMGENQRVADLLSTSPMVEPSKPAIVLPAPAPPPPRVPLPATAPVTAGPTSFAEDEEPTHVLPRSVDSTDDGEEARTEPSLVELEPVSLDSVSLVESESVTAKAPPPPKLAPPRPVADQQEAKPAFHVPPPPPVERGLRRRLPSELPARGTKPPPLRFDEPLVLDDDISDMLSALPSAREVAAAIPEQPDSEPTADLVSPPDGEPDQRAGSLLDLSAVEDFADMPEETRTRFKGEAIIHALKADEEVSGFGLAWVIEGQVAVMAVISDMAAVRLDAGAVLRSRGTVDERVPLRLVCTSPTARVAVWSEDSVLRSFEALPWVEDELRETADRVHALIGATLGSLGDAFGQAMFDEVTTRLDPRRFVEGETIVEAGAELPGLIILGVGVIELLDAEGSVTDTLDVGMILFGAALLSMEAAPASARAGKGGAVVLMVDRMTAQEMIVTIPPLLEQLTIA